ncbi:MAG: CinA family protein [Hyphomicrobiaceae bacterium]|nr:CinA family protein [Hyphomicrobiaceae bacterium]
MFSTQLINVAERSIKALIYHKCKLVTAESCTGGLIAAVLTEIPGSSAAFDRGFVTYSNQSKIDNLDVPECIVKRYGAVSHEAAIAMAKGAINSSTSDISVAVTGIAGPAGGTTEKPVGLVHIALARRNSYNIHERFEFENTCRSSVRRDAAMAALNLIIKVLNA